MTQAPPGPPRIAVLLIALFVPDEQAPSVLGDLLEEFFDVAAKSSVANAQRWYWRQALPTILHLLRSGFRAAPWFMAGVVAGGIVLAELGRLFMDWSVGEGFRYLNQHVFPYLHGVSHLEVRLEVLLLNCGMILYRLTVWMLTGCIVALLCKRREMLATLALSFVCSIPALTRFLVYLRGWNRYETLLTVLPVLLYCFGGLFAIVVGGVIVRWHRLRLFCAGIFGQ
jgi:hypothetical protein